MLQRRISESKKVGALNSDAARLLYTWLIVWVDCEGRHTADPDLIKGRILPKCQDWDLEKVRLALKSLNDGGLIKLYKYNGEEWLEFSRTIQKLDKSREAVSRIPPAGQSELFESSSGPTREYSGPTRENSSLIKLKGSKLNETKGRVQEEPGPLDAGKLFGELWDAWPKDGRFAKKESRAKFSALVKAGKLVDLQRSFQQYFKFLAKQRNDKNFDQRVMYLKTFLNGRWEEYADMVIKPSL